MPAEEQCVAYQQKGCDSLGNLNPKPSPPLTHPRHARSSHLLCTQLAQLLQPARPHLRPVLQPHPWPVQLPGLTGPQRCHQPQH